MHYHYGGKDQLHEQKPAVPDLPSFTWITKKDKS